MKTIKQISQWFILALFYLLASCTADEGPFFIDNPDNEITEVSYLDDIQTIFSSRCIACHDEFHSSGLNLKEGVSYNMLVDVVTSGYSPNVRIKPLNKEESVLWNKIINNGVFGGKMPQIGAPLSNFEIRKIEKWIELGALND